MQAACLRVLALCALIQYSNAVDVKVYRKLMQHVAAVHSQTSRKRCYVEMTASPLARATPPEILTYIPSEGGFLLRKGPGRVVKYVSGQRGRRLHGLQRICKSPYKTLTDLKG